jgi:hypothetical protein
MKNKTLLTLGLTLALVTSGTWGLFSLQEDTLPGGDGQATLAMEPATMEPAPLEAQEEPPKPLCQIAGYTQEQVEEVIDSLNLQLPVAVPSLAQPDLCALVEMILSLLQCEGGMNLWELIQWLLEKVLDRVDDLADLTAATLHEILDEADDLLAPVPLSDKPVVDLDEVEEAVAMVTSVTEEVGSTVAEVKSAIEMETAEEVVEPAETALPAAAEEDQVDPLNVVPIEDALWPLLVEEPNLLAQTKTLAALPAIAE